MCGRTQKNSCSVPPRRAAGMLLPPLSPAAATDVDQLLLAGGDERVQVLAFQGGGQAGELLLVGLDADGGEHALDVLGGGRGVAGEHEEQVGGEVLHLEQR